MRRRFPRARRLAMVAAVLVGATVTGVAVQPRWVIRLLAARDSRIVWSIPTDQPLAALTFDDGPDTTYTPQVLYHLARHGAKATFFLIGGHARRNMALVERMRREGHEVANHTSSLEGTWRQPIERFRSSVIDAERLLGLESAAPRFLRPAGGLIRGPHLDWARSHGYLCVLGSAYPYDPASPPVAYMTWLISKNLEPGAIVILHDAGRGSHADRSRTVAAVPAVLDAGRRKGLRFVTLSALWSARRRS